MKHFVLFFMLGFFADFLFAQPVISSFTPASGPIGTSVSIIGNNFSPVRENNIVFFGAVKALVIDATPALLQVIVPAGSTFQPITITVNNLTAFSNKPFIVSFQNGNIDAASFSAPVPYPTGQHPQSIINSDLDADGKSDIILSNRYTNYLSVYQNFSTISQFSFNNINAFLQADEPYDISAGDLNGDGKPEIVTSNFGTNKLTVYQNISVPGSINMTSGTNLIVGAGPTSVAIADFDGDGKPDLVSSNYGVENISVLVNTSTSGIISFAPKIDLPSLIHTFSIKAEDLNNDNKPEIIVVNYNSGSISIWKNTSSPGNVDFDERIDINVSPYPLFSLAIGDIDNDNKPDIVTVEDGIYRIYILKNNGVGGSISFANAASYANTNVGTQQVILSDFNGDAKLDVILTSDNGVKVLQNESTPLDISFGPDIFFPTLIVAEEYATSASAGDFDSDGKMDIAASFSIFNDSGFISVFGNRINSSICPNGNTGFAAHIAGDSYQWQINTGTGYTDIVDNSLFFGSTTDSLRITQTPSSFYGYSFRCKIINATGTLFSQEYLLRFAITWIGSIDQSWENPGNWSCGILPDSSTDVIITGGTVVVNSNTAIRSLTAGLNVSFIVRPGVSFMIIN